MLVASLCVTFKRKLFTLIVWRILYECQGLSANSNALPKSKSIPRCQDNENYLQLRSVKTGENYFHDVFVNAALW